MNTCDKCGGPMVPLFTGSFCKAECDRPPPPPIIAPDRQTYCGSTKAPLGWVCTRFSGHEGPCAAVPTATPGSGKVTPAMGVPRGPSGGLDDIDWDAILGDPFNLGPAGGGTDGTQNKLCPCCGTDELGHDVGQCLDAYGTDQASGGSPAYAGASCPQCGSQNTVPWTSSSQGSCHCWSCGHVFNP